MQEAGWASVTTRLTRRETISAGQTHCHLLFNGCRRAAWNWHQRTNVSRTWSPSWRIIDVVRTPNPRFAEAGDGGTGAGAGKGSGAGGSIESIGAIP